MRQWGSRYAIRAGRNLPDKEFRYLRMVIVTTAVYWRLSSPPRPHGLTGPLTFQHRAGVSPYTSSYDLAWTCVFSKQSLPPALCGHTTLPPHGCSRVRPPFSLSYGGNLPSSLTTVRPSPRYSLPDHLCRFRVRAARNIARGFSRQHRITDFT